MAAGIAAHRISTEILLARIYVKPWPLFPRNRELFFNMKYFDDMKYEDISEILGTTVGALKASYHLAVKKIEKYMERFDHGD